MLEFESKPDRMLSAFAESLGDLGDELMKKLNEGFPPGTETDSSNAELFDPVMHDTISQFWGASPATQRLQVANMQAYQILGFMFLSLDPLVQLAQDSENENIAKAKQKLSRGDISKFRSKVDSLFGEMQTKLLEDFDSSGRAEAYAELMLKSTAECTEKERSAYIRSRIAPEMQSYHQALWASLFEVSIPIFKKSLRSKVEGLAELSEEQRTLI